MAPYNASSTADDIIQDVAQHITGKVILTTGVSPTGLGAAFCQAIAKASPKLLILAGRSPARVEETAKAITSQYPNVAVRALTLDLANLAQVREAAKQVNAWTDVDRIDVLVNNAGVMAKPFELIDGVESQFLTNHLGPFLFTNLVMDKILKSESRRVVCVSSDGHRLSHVRFDDYNFENGKQYNKWWAYGQSKTANILMAISLAEKLGNKGLVASSLHPGVIMTSLASHLDWEADFGALQAADKALGNREGWAEVQFKSQDQGVATHVYAAFHPDIQANNGAYLQDGHVADPAVETVKPWATSSVEAERLWKLSEKLVGQEFAY